MEYHQHDDDDKPKRTSKRLRRSSGEGEEDRISSLPNEILLQILTLLPINNAISTSLLSKRWTFLWKSLPSLVFRHDEGLPSEFVSRVQKTLLYYDTNDNIQHFCLVCNVFKNDYSTYDDYYEQDDSINESDIDSWVYTVIKLKVKELELLFNKRSDYLKPCWQRIVKYYELPRSLFRHKLLTKLRLSYCNLRNCPNQTRWIGLKSLSITHAVFEDDNLLPKLLTACAKLECLELSNCSGLNRIDVDCRDLKELSLSDCRSGKTIRISAPKLEVLVLSGPLRYMKLQVDDHLALLNEASILNFTDVRDNDSSDSKISVRDIVRVVRHAKKLTLGIWWSNDLFSESLLPCSFTSCKTLILDVKLKEWSLTSLPSIVDTCPKTETLILRMTHCNKVGGGARNCDEKSSWMQVNNNDDYSLSRHLKLVKMNLVFPSSEDVEEVVGFVQFILKQGY